MEESAAQSDRSVPVLELIAIPSVITFVVTLVRLIGELQNWSPVLFNKEAGGGGSPVGIAWLVPIFGAYFAYQLIKRGYVPVSGWRVIGSCIAGIALLVVTGFVVNALKLPPLAQLIIFGVVALVGAWIAAISWPALGRTLLAYGFAARIPVAIIMLIAMLGNWGTHYDVAPPDPEAAVIGTWSPFMKWLAIGLWPQFTGWIGFTLAIGGIFGGIVALVKRRGHADVTVPDAGSVA
jgi:hypothetical protein